MGLTSTCTLSYIEKTQQLKKFGITFDWSLVQLNLEQKQQSDNPLYGSVVKSLIGPTILASNNLLNQQICQSTLTKFSSFSRNKQKQINHLRYNYQPNKYTLENQHYKKFDSTYDQAFNQINNINNINQDPLSTFTSYVLSSNNFYQGFQRIQIKNQDFIKLKKKPIQQFYNFCQKIGQGAYGNVYKAIQKRNKQIRAIKSIKHSRMSQQKINQFNMQMEILRQLDHPNIIKLYQIFQQQQTNIYHVVTQYCVGGTLIDYLLSGKKLNQNQMKIIFVQLISALNYIHKRKIVHRDLKLQNIVFLKPIDQDSTQDQIQIKLIDFGTACKLNSRIKFIRNVVGTQSYMAPQIINRYFNQKCDIWSAGVILYMLVTNRSPFKGVDKQHTFSNIRQLDLTYDQFQWNILSPNCKDLVKKILMKFPQRRISASNILNHQWLNYVPTSSFDIQQNKSLIGNLEQYYRGNNLISKIQFYLTFIKINQQQRKKITQMFKYLDKNNDGTIDVSQLKVAYIVFHGKQNQQSQKQLQYILSKIDKNKSGKIDLSQFTAAVYDKRKLFIRKSLQEAFQYFDTDCSGFIEKEQLKKLLEGCQNQQFQKIIQQIDVDFDQKISKEEFFAYLLKKNFYFQSEN